MIISYLKVVWVRRVFIIFQSPPMMKSLLVLHIFYPGFTYSCQSFPLRFIQKIKNTSFSSSWRQWDTLVSCCRCAARNVVLVMFSNLWQVTVTTEIKMSTMPYLEDSSHTNGGDNMVWSCNSSSEVLRVLMVVFQRLLLNMSPTPLSWETLSRELELTLFSLIIHVTDVWLCLLLLISLLMSW